MSPLLLLACSDHSLSLRYEDPLHGEAVIAVDPELVDFFAGLSGEELTRTITVSNRGTAALFVDPLELESGPFAVQPLEAFTLEPGATRELTARFTPFEPDRMEAVLSVRSNDAERPEVQVLLTGEGLTPWLQISPQDHDFGEAALSCPQDQPLLLQNVGLETLHLEGFESTGSLGFTYLPEEAWPLSLAPGAFTRVSAHWVPAVEGQDDGELSVTSDDPRGVVLASQRGVGLGGEWVTDRFEAEQSPPVDLLFAVDQSCSMDDDAQALADNFGAFVATLNSQTWRWRIGVVTWDHACFNGGVLQPGTPDLVQVFGAAVVDGEDLDINDDEALLKLSSRALAQTGSGSCNASFLRAGAPLHVIVISDEPERSTEQASAWTWDYWLDEMNADAPGRSITVHGVVDAEGCNEGDEGYAQAIASTGGEHLSICSADWAQHVATLAESVLTTLWVFELSQQPVSGSLSVTVDGSSSQQWTYDPQGNAVVFSVELEAGQQVEVRYAVAGACE